MKRILSLVLCLLAAGIFASCSTKVSSDGVSESGRSSDGGRTDGVSETLRPQSSSQLETRADSENSGLPESKIPLLLPIEAKEGKPRYEVCRWNMESGRLEKQNTVVESLEPEGLQIFWNGRDYLVSNPPVRCEDETLEVKGTAFGSACYQGGILRYTDGFENSIWGDRTKLTLTTDGADAVLDLSGMTTPDGKYRPEELLLSGFLLEEETLYVLFCPDMMLEENLQLYLVEMNLEDRSITKVTAIDAPENCSPADPPIANNVFAKAEEGFFVFGSDSVVRVDPHGGTVSTVFSPSSFEEGTAPHFYIKKIGTYQDFLLVEGEDADWNYYLFAVKDGKVAGTLETGEQSFHMPNLV